ncbi:efflux RND transporter periplasmic adaptor subunit [Dyadobacter tibetensis]|uniref:efflux RND transporter periplasmic adaptor subunit n=1 Tax=Dyadobacter tibetensis TaxID=1211851 RepID=UPI00047054A3|nr:efflux RND transporter periplasmic adaptor subunit [Dyadobacter tibetensis]
MNRIFTTILVLTVSLSCTTDKQDKDLLARADSTTVGEVTHVQTAPAQSKTFVAQIISNGKVLAAQEIPLSFQSQGIITHIAVKNGVSVKAGQLIASMHNDAQKLALREAQLQLEESRVEVSDQLITQGGKRGDTASVSKEVYAYIKLRSGYNRALLAVQKAQLELSKTFLYCPVAGTVANLTVSNYSSSPSDKPLCTLLNRKEMLIRCPILETELAAVLVGQSGQVEPIGRPGRVYKAKVLDINPVVSSQGLVDVTIQVLKPDAMLLSGMNVRVMIEKSFPGQLVVPKQAVVERSGRKVIFTYKDGLAKWHYVTTGRENDRNVTITEGLEAGEEVILSGHLNLGHDAKVEKTEVKREKVDE